MSSEHKYELDMHIIVQETSHDSKNHMSPHICGCPAHTLTCWVLFESEKGLQETTKSTTS